MVAVPGPPPTPRPPGRVLLRLAGAFSQLSCGACLLIGTIGFVLIQQTKAGGVAPVAAWLVMAMAGLVFGGLIYRGGLVSMLIAAAIDAGFGVSLIAIEYDTLRQLLRILPASDVEAIGTALDVAGFVMIGAGAFCLAALPQGIRYARWFRDAAATRSAMSTARGFPPPPVPARTSAYIIPTEDHPGSRRRLYMVLGGVAIGVGAGIGVLVSSTHSAPDDPPRRPPVASTTAVPPAPPPAVPPPAIKPAPPVVVPEANAAGGGTAIRPPAADPARVEVPTATLPVGTVDDLLAAQRVAMVNADRKALAALLAPDAFGFGIDADEIADGRDQVAAQMVRDLGEPPRGGFTVESKARSIGTQRGHAWIAEDIELAAAGRERRRLAISALAAVIDGKWRIVALHWATPVDDATAERAAILSTLPSPLTITDRHDGSDELDQAVRAAFASRAAFADARSERPDAFNYGSGGERAHGPAIKRIFSKLKAQIHLHDGARVCAGSAWDAVQRSEPWIGWAAVNVDFTSKTHAATDVTQTFRVLAILIKEGSDWKVVQTQWSNGGPVH